MVQEHKCVLDSCRSLEMEGFHVTYLPVQSNGVIDLKVSTHLVLTLCGRTRQKTNQGGLGSADQSMKKPILVSLILFRHPLKTLMLEAPTAC